MYSKQMPEKKNYTCPVPITSVSSRNLLIVSENTLEIPLIYYIHMVPGRTYKVYSPIAHTSSPINLMLLCHI